MAETMEHLSDFVFISIASVTLARRDSYLAHAKSGLKQDTQAQLPLTTLCLDNIPKMAEEDTAQYENKGHYSSSSHRYLEFCSECDKCPSCCSRST